jgi:NCAIR mutase (PurE)-related protein
MVITMQIIAVSGAGCTDVPVKTETIHVIPSLGWFSRNRLGVAADD